MLCCFNRCLYKDTIGTWQWGWEKETNYGGGRASIHQICIISKNVSLSAMTELRNRTIPYGLEQLGIFTYKVLVWLFLGIVIGSFVAQVQGFMPMWFIVVHILGSIALGWVFGLVYLGYIDHKARLSASVPSYGANSAAPARIDHIYYAGIRMMEKRDLMVIEVSVFPRSGKPYQTTIRQFVTAQQLDQLDEGTVVSFYEDAHDPGYGTISPELPTGELRADVETFRADTIFPERRKTGLLLLVGRNPNVFTRSVSMVLIFALFGFGFLSPFIMTGNVDWLRLRMTYFPQKLVFQYKGNFNPEAFRKTYDKAIEHIGDRHIESLLFYKDFTAVRAEDSDKPGFIAHTTITGNLVEEGILSSTAAEPDRLFTVDSIRFDLFRKALDDVGTDHDVEDIMYIGVRKRSGRDVTIHIVFSGGRESLDYHGETGVRLPK